MLREEDAWAILTPVEFSTFVALHGTRRSRIAPSGSVWITHSVGPGQRAYAAHGLSEQLQLWHTLACCPGFSGSENPVFWRRVIQRTMRGNRDLCERVHGLFADSQAFPNLRLHIVDGNPRSLVTKWDHQPSMAMHFLKQLFGQQKLGMPAPSAWLLTRLAQLEPFVDQQRRHQQSQVIPVKVVYQIPFFEGTSTTWACSDRITRLHDWLLALQDDAHADSEATTTNGKPRYTLQSIQLVGIHDMRVAMNRELQRLLDDPRLQHIEFPRIGIAGQIHRAKPKTWRRFLHYVLRPSTRDLAPHARLPHSLTLSCRAPSIAMDDRNSNLETFFQLLPFTQAIRSLTLDGIDTHWRSCAWLGFALFHPAAHVSSLRKLCFISHTLTLDHTTFTLFVQAARLRLASAEDFAEIVESYAAMAAADEMPSLMDRLATVLDTVTPPERTAPISSVVVDLTSLVHTTPVEYRNQNHHTSPTTDAITVDVSAWTLVLALLATTLQSIYIQPLDSYERPYHPNPLALACDPAALLLVVRHCCQLTSLSFPMASPYTSDQLTALLHTTQHSLVSLEVHAHASAIHVLLQAMAQRLVTRQPHTLRNLSLIVLDRLPVAPQGDDDAWSLCETLLLLAPPSLLCLEYLYLHMESLPWPRFGSSSGDPIGETARRIQSLHGELLPRARAAETTQLTVAFLSVVYVYGQSAIGRMDAVLVAHIVGLVRPRVRRHVGIDWYGGGGINTINGSVVRRIEGDAEYGLHRPRRWGGIPVNPRFHGL